MQRKQLLSIFVVAVSLYAQGTPKDDRLYDQVRMKLAADPIAGRSALEVSVKEGVVTLSGKVHTEKEKQRAEHIARKVKGVASVTNNMKVE